jgi:2-methylisocitrate lyase-like PEP mutase family enzyme
MQTTPSNAPRTTLRQQLELGHFVLAPGVFDMFSARIADRMNFAALYMTGYGISGSYLGKADAGLVTYTDMVGRARCIVEGTHKPLIADADTGFGGLLNVRDTIRGYEAAGVEAIQIEDQEVPKKCGHTPNRRVLPLRDAVRRIEVAVDARRHEHTMIVARTDARTALGLDEAIVRGKAFARAGADIVFVEAPESGEEFQRIGAEVDAWLLANMVPTGRSPVVERSDLVDWGFDVAIYPTAGMNVACAAIEASYLHLLNHGSTTASLVPAYTMAQLHDLVGFPEVWAFERRFVES